ncbi:hypothetical protein EDB86DRAFT_2998073 [Lactarius hatsudake]|nr:hypothetical protein EDB86DRAFT_2998073 [Lactarius hatsudake]
MASWSYSLRTHSLLCPLQLSEAIQDSNHYLASDQMNFDTGSLATVPPADSSEPRISLDNGMFHLVSPSNVYLEDRRVHMTNERRLHQQEPVPPYEGVYPVQDYGKAYPQQRLTLPNGLYSRSIDLGQPVVFVSMN